MGNGNGKAAVVIIKDSEEKQEERQLNKGSAELVLNDNGNQRSRRERPSNIPRATEGEQVAAGWPSWLSAVAGEAIKGWVPRRADTFEKLDKIGDGSYSTVYKARDIVCNRIVALKKVRLDNFEPESVKFMAREILILRRLDHPNVIKLEGVVTSRMSSSLYLVFEYMEHDLTGLASIPDIKFTESQVKSYMHQLLCGLEHCHNRFVLHRDIKSSNLLINHEGILKIADFGLSTFFNPQHKFQLTSRVVTLWYRPPELLLGATNYGVAVDLWSTGCVLGELSAGKPIMQGRTEVEQLHKIFKLCGSPSEDYWTNNNLPHATVFKPQHPYRRSLEETFEEFPAVTLKLLETLLSFDPDSRGTASLALKSELSNEDIDAGRNSDVTQATNSFYICALEATIIRPDVSQIFFTTAPFACDPSSLPKYPANKATRVEALRPRAPVRFMGPDQYADLRGAKQHGQHLSNKTPSPDQVFVPSDNIDEMLEEHDLSIWEAAQQRRLETSKKVEVQSNKVAKTVEKRDNRIQGSRQARHEKIKVDKVLSKMQETANLVYSNPSTVSSIDVDKLLEEHDRHIQESAQKIRFEKRKMRKVPAQAD